MDQHVDASKSVYFDVLPELEVQIEEEEGGCMEQSIYLPVESYFDPEAQAKTNVTATNVDADLELEAVVEKLAMGSHFELDAHVETGLPATLDTKIVLEEIDVIESESLKIVEVDTIVGTRENMIKEFMLGVVEESETELEVEDAIEEPNSDVDHAAHVGPQAETAVEEGDVIGGSIYNVVESDYDLDADEEGDVISGSIYQGVESDYDLDVDKEGDVIGESAVGLDYNLNVEAEDMVEEAILDVVEEEEDMVEREVDMVKEEDDFVEEEDVMVKEKHDAIDDALESRNSLEAKTLVEGVAMEESIYEPLESSSDLKAQEPYSDFEPKEPEDLRDEQTDSSDDESDLSEEEWDLDAEEYSDMDPEDDSDMDSSDFDRTEEEEDDVVVSYLKSSTPIQNKAWKSLVPTWVKLSVTNILILENFSLLESFLGRGPMLILQECGNAVINVIETLLCELSRIRNDLCHVLRTLFCQRETTKQA